MKTLREKIEGLKRVGFCPDGPIDDEDGDWLPRADVLRILAEHEQPIPDVTPGGAQQQTLARVVRFKQDQLAEEQTARERIAARNEPTRWDPSLPPEQIPAYLCKVCNLEVEVGETFGSCPKCSKPMEVNPRWMAKSAGVEQMAGGRVE